MTHTLGAYGLRLRGLDAAARWMVVQAADAPILELVTSVAAPDEAPSHLDAGVANLSLLGGGRLRARRGEQRVSFSLPAPVTADELIHPYLAPAAALVWQWSGREALHGGVVALGGSAVLMLGAKESGKSTMLAWLAREHGTPVLADDLAIIDRGQVLAGPRMIDLRPDRAIDGGTAVRGGERVRIDVAASPTSLPVAGTVVLAWGPRLAVEPIAPRDRLSVLAGQRTYPLAGDPAALLDLAALPMFTISRPRQPEECAVTATTLLRRFG